MTTPSTPQQQPVSFRPVSYTPCTEKQQRTSFPSTSPERPTIPMERRSTVHFDDESAPNEAPTPSTPVDTKPLAGTKTSSHGSNRSASRSSTREAAAPDTTKPAQSSLEVYDRQELTAVDKKWGLLFEIDNQPTERFREVMHSLSRYIIRAFPSSENIVLVPAKLASFYNFHGVNGDPFSYKLIFQSGERDLNRRIAELYQDLGCSYHLVQASLGLQPRVPGLTPDGFTRWMALHLQAFPDGVFQRLCRVISDFPLDAVSPLDGRTERLPKQLSRYLLPRVPDGRIRSLLQQAVKRHIGESALLSFSFPNEKSSSSSSSSNSRPTPYTSQSCPASPSSRSFPSPSSSTSTPVVFQSGYRDSHGHRASDPGTVSHSTPDEKVVPLTHRRHASYPGSQQSRSRRSSELVHDHRESRESREYDRDREQLEDRRHRSPSRPRSSRQSSILSTHHSSPAPMDKKEEAVRRSHHRQHSLSLRDEKGHHRSESRDSRRRSSSRSSHSGSLPSSSSSCLVTGSTAMTSSNSSSTRNKYPPSPLSTVHPSSHSHSRSRSTTPASAARDGSRPPSSAITAAAAAAATTNNTPALRAPTPNKIIHHSARSSLPEIHYTDRRRQSSMTMRGEGNDLARDAMEHSAEINRRGSYYSPSAAATMVEDEPRRVKSREYSHRMERRASSGEEQNYRLYGSPVSGEAVTRAQVSAANKTDVTSTPRSSSSSPRVYPTRLPVSLAATVTSLEDEQARLNEDDGTQSDQTWEDYLQANPRGASVA